MNTKFSRLAFTLIELMVVIAIIALLAGLLFPALKGARTAATKAKTRVAVNSMAIGLKAYYNEYGHYPTISGSPTPPTTILTSTYNNGLMLMLSGKDLYLDGNTGGNPRKITFLDFKNSDLKPVDPAAVKGVYPYVEGGTTNVVDGWNNAIMVRFDDDGDGFVETFGSADPGAKIEAPFALWSAGADKAVDATESKAYAPKQPLNKDNVGSWY